MNIKGKAHTAHPRGISGKFQHGVLYQVEDIRRFMRVQVGGCIKTPDKIPFGHLRDGIWYIQIGELTEGGRRKIRKVVEVLWRFYYPYSLIRHGTRNRRLERTCDTAGCLNYRHYEMVNRNGNTFGETYMARQEIINLLTAALEGDESITFGDEASAESFRMHIYRMKRRWKKENDPFHQLFQDVVIKKGRLNKNILDFTSNGRAFDGVLARFKEAPNGTVEEPMGVEEKEYLDGVVSGRDYGTEALEKYGYSPGGAGKEMNAATAGILPLRDGGQTAFTYEAVQAKAMAANMAGGDRLTKEEEEILSLGGVD